MNGRTNSTNGSQIDIDITKSPFATLPPTNLTALRGNQKIDLGWTNPVTEMATPGGYVVAKRAYTLVLRNEDHFPTDRSDGVEIYRDTNTEDSSIGAYSDTGLTNGKNYYYGFISVTDNEIPSTVAEIDMIPTMGVGYTGSLENLSLRKDTSISASFLGGLSAATADNKQAIFMQLNTINGSDMYAAIQNVNAYNTALTKQDIEIEYQLDDTTYSSVAFNTSPVSFDKYALFGACGSSYRCKLVSVVVFDSNITIVTPFPKFSEDCEYRHGTAFNDHACWYSSSQWDGSYTQWPRNFEILSKAMTMSGINYTQWNIDGMNTSGLRTVGEYLCIGPGWSRNVSTNAYEYTRQAYFINKEWTIQGASGGTEYPYGYTFQQPATNNTSNMLESTGTYILYTNGGTKIETIDENATVGMSLTNPFATSTASHWSHDDYVIIFAKGTPGDCVAYDRYLTATYPSDVNQSHTNAAATSIQNHALFAGASYALVDAYST